MLFKIVIRNMRKSNKNMIFQSSRMYFLKDFFFAFLSSLLAIFKEDIKWNIISIK